MKKLHLIILAILLVAYFFLHYSATSGNNIYFTIDQGSDAIHAREIWHNQKIFLKGPETSIRGVFAGPLWYYFITPGLILLNGHPIGSVYTLLILNLILLSLIFWWITQKINIKTAFLISIALAFSWHFFQTSLYTFNPFPTVALSFVLMFLLIEFLQQKKIYYFLSVALSLFAFNFDVAIAVVLLLFTCIIGAWGFRKNIITLKEYVVSTFLIPAFGLLFLAKQFITIFLETKVVNEQSAGLGVFTGTNIYGMIIEFTKIIGQLIPQNTAIGCILFAVTIYHFYKLKKVNTNAHTFVTLTLVLTIVSFVFFASNKGWRSWHTVYLFPLIYVSFLLAAIQFKKRFSFILISVVVIAQFFNFTKSFTEYRKPSNDPSLLYNELSAIDWVYEHSENQGFKVYNYTDRFYDDPYQYLFWWHGITKYGYLPDEYANYPLSHKELYVPGNLSYLEPKRGSDRISFLIVQSDTNGETNKDWITVFRQHHELIEETTIGAMSVEKYYRKNGAPSDFCLWWERCD